MINSRYLIQIVVLKIGITIYIELVVITRIRTSQNEYYPNLKSLEVSTVRTKL